MVWPGGRTLNGAERCQLHGFRREYLHGMQELDTCAAMGNSIPMQFIRPLAAAVLTIVAPDHGRILTNIKDKGFD